MMSKKQRPTFREPRRRFDRRLGPQPKAPAHKKRAPRKGSSDEEVRVAANTVPTPSPLIMSREEVAMAFRDLRAGSPSFAKDWGERLFATLGAFRAKAERLEREAATEAGEYEKLGAEIGRLVEQKQAAYGDAVAKTGEMMRILYPDGIPPEKMGDALIVIRILDKLSRIATDRDALGESPYRDIAGYGLLGAARVEKKR